jgi:hypothetical protein
LRSLLIAVALPVAMTAGTAQPASALTDATGTVTGAGSINPPLDLVPAWHQFNFSGLAVVSGVVCNVPQVALPVDVHADGVDLEGNVAAGVGTLNVHMEGCTWSGVWVRVGASVSIALTSPVGTFGSAWCGFVPGQVTPPVTTFSVSCVAHLASVQ